MPRDLGYFTDHCLGPQVLPGMLRDAGMRVFTHDDLGLAYDTLDHVWIPKVAARGLVIITSDKRIRQRPLELRAVVTSRAKYFAVSRSDRKAEANAEIILRHLPAVETLVSASRSYLIVQINSTELLRHDARNRLVPVRLGRKRR